MKTTPTLLLIISLLLSFVFSSCKKEKSSSDLSPRKEEEIAVFSTKSEIETETIFNDVFDNLLGVNTEVGLGGTGVFGRLSGTAGHRETNVDSVPSCMTLSVSRLNLPEPFPVKIVFDFGNGCTAKDGHKRSGKIITEYTGRLTMAGKSATAVFDGFHYDSIAVDGTYKISNTIVTAGLQFTIDVTNAKLTKPGSNYTQWASQRIITQTGGAATPALPLDDVFSITGKANGRVKQGNELWAWHSQIIKPLQKKFACRWISGGTTQIWRESLSSSSMWAAGLDYGDGSCDYEARITLNGAANALQLPH